MDSDGQDQSDDEQTNDLSRFGPPRTGSPFEPSRIGPLFGFGREKQSTMADEPPAVVVEPEIESEVEVPVEAELESEQPNEPEPILMSEFETETEAELAEQPKQEIETVSETALESDDHLDSVEYELPAVDQDHDQREPDVFAQDEPEHANSEHVELERVEVSPEPVAVVDSELEVVVEDVEDTDLEDENEADVIQIASYVETDELAVEGDEDAEAEPHAQVINLASAATGTDGADAEIIDLEFDDSNVIDLPAQQTAAAVSPFSMDGTASSIETEEDDIEAELESGNESEDTVYADVESDLVVELEPDSVEAEFEIVADVELEVVGETIEDQTIEDETPDTESEADEFVAEPDFGASFESGLEIEIDSDTDSNLDGDIELEADAEPELEVEPELEADAALEVEADVDVDNHTVPTLDVEVEAELDVGAEESAEREFGVPVVPMYSVGAAIELLDTASDEADEVLDSDDSGVIVGADLQNEPEQDIESVEQDIESVEQDIDSVEQGIEASEENLGAEENPDIGHEIDSDDELEIDDDDMDAETPVLAKTPFGLVPQQFSETNSEVTPEEPAVPGMPALEDLRAMALDLDDIDAILERLDSDPDALDLDVPPVEQTLDLSLTD